MNGIAWVSRAHAYHSEAIWRRSWHISVSGAIATAVMGARGRIVLSTNIILRRRNTARALTSNL